MNQSKKTKTLLVAVILFFIIIGVYYAFTSQKETRNISENNQVSNNNNADNITESPELLKNAEQIIRNIMAAEEGSAMPEVIIVKATDNHIKANVFFNPGGAYVLAAQVDGEWKKVLEGNGIPKCFEVDPFGFPEDMVPGCVDENNNIRKNEWELIKSSVINCEAEEVMQTHLQYVTAKLKDGRIIEGVEPAIDDIMDLAVKMQDKCGKIIMATE